MPGEVRRIAGVDFEIRGDATYVTAERNTPVPASAAEFRKALEAAGVTNAEPERILDALFMKSGRPVRVGPPFVFYDFSKDRYIFIQAEPLRAKVTVYSTLLRDNVRVTVEDILFRLKTAGVVHGIREPIIRDLILRNRYDLETLVAEATPAVNGADGRVEEKIRPDVSLKPHILENGSCDFRFIDNLKTVAQGALLAERHPPGEPRDGMSVTGKVIRGEPGADAPIKPGPNTEVAADGLHLLASRAGYVYRTEDGSIGVGEIYAVRGDVDYSVGNIRYAGDVVVERGVLPGFEISADRSIVVLGAVEAANLRSDKGSITVKGGVFGKGRTEITAAGAVRLSLVQNAMVRAGADILLEQYAMNSELFAGGALKAGTVIGGTAAGCKGISIRDAGNEGGAVTWLVLADPEYGSLEKKRFRVEEFLAGEEKELARLRELLPKLNAELDKLKGGAGSQALREKILEHLETLQCQKSRGEFLERQLRKIREAQEARLDFPARLEISGTCHLGVRVRILDREYLVPETLTGIVFYLSEGRIRSERL